MLLDVRLPGPSGLDLQAALQRQGVALPVIFLTGHADVPTSVRAMKAGAVDFLEKPVERDTLLDAIARALARDAAQRAARDDAHRQSARFAVLTPREREVFDRIVAGKLNKQIADELGIGLRTVKAYRAQLMEKLGVDSAAELGRLAGERRDPSGLTTNPPGRSTPPLSFGAATLHLGPLSNAAPSRATIRVEPARSIGRSPVNQATRRSEMAMGARQEGTRGRGRRRHARGDRNACWTPRASNPRPIASAEALLAADAVDDAVCVISDLKLPAMSGLELLAALRARGEACAGHLDHGARLAGRAREAERLGAAAYLSKPFAGSELLAAIEGVAANPERVHRSIPFAFQPRSKP